MYNVTIKLYQYPVSNGMETKHREGKEIFAGWKGWEK